MNRVELIQKAISGFEDIKWVHEQAAFLAMSLEGMVRHHYLSPDYIAHDCLHAEAYSKIDELIPRERHPVGGAAALIQERLIDALGLREALKEKPAELTSPRRYRDRPGVVS